MHGAPKLLIIAKREVAGGDMPDFSGPGFHEARKCAIEGESEMMDPVGSGDKDLKEKLFEVSEGLEEVVRMQKRHAETLRQIIGAEDRRYSGDSPDAEGEDKKGAPDKFGKAKELA